MHCQRANWALQSVCTLPVADAARYSVEVKALRAMLWTDACASDFARVREAAYEMILGRDHEATLHMKLVNAVAWVQEKNYLKAYFQILDIEVALFRKVQETEDDWESLWITAKQQKAFCLWHLSHPLRDTDMEAETEYCDILQFMRESGVMVSSSALYLTISQSLARFMKFARPSSFRTRQRRRTRAAKAVWLRTMEVVREAHTVHVLVYGPNEEESRGLHADMMALQSYAAKGCGDRQSLLLFECQLTPVKHIRR